MDDSRNIADPDVRMLTDIAASLYIGIWLGIAPFNAHCWIVPKSIMMEKWRSGEIRSQHGGSTGRDTAWLTVAQTMFPNGCALMAEL